MGFTVYPNVGLENYLAQHTYQTVVFLSPDLFDDVFVCVEGGPNQNATTVTWTIATYIHATCCDLLYYEKKASVSSVVQQSLSPTGTFELTNLKASVVYVVQMTCFVSSCDGPSGSNKSFKSNEVSFVSGKRKLI